MKEVVITFDAFFSVVRHLVERLTKHAIRRHGYSESTTTSFLLFVDAIGINKLELDEVLNFFSGGSGRYDYKTVDKETYTGTPYRIIIEPIKFFNFRYQNDNEIIIDIYDVSDVRTTFIRDLYENLRGIANNSYKRTLFEKFIQQTKILKTLGLIYNTEASLQQGKELRYVFDEITNLRNEFSDELFDFGIELCSTIRYLPKLVNNEDKYYERTKVDVELDYDATQSKLDDVGKGKSILCLTYIKNQLFLNDRLICKCNPGSGNDNLLKFLISNPNKTWARIKLEEKNVLITNVEHGNRGKYDKSFHTFLVDIKVSGQNGYSNIGKVFFGIDKSKNSLHLKNPIYDEDLKEYGIEFKNEEELIEIMLHISKK